MKIPKITNKCGYLNIAISEEKRRKEMINNNKVNTDILYSGTRGYQDMGCYDCSGYDRECESYFSPLEEYLKGMGKQ